VKVAMDVATESSEAIGVNRNVAEDQPVEDMVSPYIAEILCVFLESKDIMVALNKDLVAVEAIEDRKEAAVDYYVAKMINLITRTNSIVPHPDHVLVHLLWICPRSNLGHSISFCELTHTSVAEVCVTNYKRCWHIMLHYVEPPATIYSSCAFG
jgi:hypothetical protein